MPATNAQRTNQIELLIGFNSATGVYSVQSTAETSRPVSTSRTPLPRAARSQ